MGNFQKYRDVLLNKHVSLTGKVRLFHVVATPTALFGRDACSLTQGQHMQLDIAQRKMLRLLTGWVRIDNEDWVGAMRRMRHCVEAKLRISPVRPWSDKWSRRHFSTATRLVRKRSGWAARLLVWHPPQTRADARRRVGRPAHSTLNGSRWLSPRMQAGTCA